MKKKLSTHATTSSDRGSILGNSRCKPPTLLVCPDGIPEPLKQLDRWLGWKWVWDDKSNAGHGKWTKVPFNVVTGRQGSSTDDSTWTDFSTAYSAAEAGEVDGIGIALGDVGDGRTLCGVDIDDCRNASTGELTEEAKSIVMLLDSYAEISPTQTGLKLLCWGKLPPGKRTNGNLECYDSGRYFCITGRLVGDAPDQLRDATAALEQFHQAIIEPPRNTSGLSDRDLALMALNHLSPVRAEGYHDWIGVGMALKSVDPGLLPDWENWSGSSSKFTPGECGEKWKSFSGTGIGLGSLIYWARQDGWELPAGVEKKDHRVVVRIENDERRIVDKVLTAVAGHPEIYVRGGVLVHIGKPGRSTKQAKSITRHESQPVIRPLELGYLRTLISSSVRFMKFTAKGGYQDVHVPDFVTRAIATCGSWLNPTIDAVTQCPFITSDGRIVYESGFDPGSACFLQGGVDIEVPERCTLDDARQAAEAILDLFVDFPFEEPYHRSAVLAAALTEPAKPAYRGATPAFLLDSNVRGVGKSLLVDCLFAVLTGHEAPRQTAPSRAEETQKLITSLAIAGESMVFIDNLDGAVGGSHLDACITATSWSGRVLGASQMFKGPFRPTWYFTGNNIQFRGDMPRRVVPIRLVSPLENPEERSGFKYSDVARHAMEHRAYYISAGLTILRAFHQADKPKAKLTPFGSFEGWSSLVRQAVVWLGYQDPCAGSRHLSRESDEQAEALRLILQNWPTIDRHDTGVLAGEICLRLDGDDELKAAFAELCNCEIERLEPKRIGWALRRVRGRVLDGYCLDSGVDPASKSKRWRRKQQP